MNLYVRESHGVSCDACGFMWDEWDTGITLAEAVAQIARDPETVDDLQVRPCPRCGNRLEWDAAITDGDRGTLGVSRQRRLAGTLRRLLREGAGPSEMERVIKERYGVIGFYIRNPPEGG